MIGIIIIAIALLGLVVFIVNIRTLIIILSSLALVGLITILIIMAIKLRPKYIERRKHKAFLKRDGYTAYTHLEKLIDMYRVYVIRQATMNFHSMNAEYTSLVMETYDKLKDIKRVYNSDRDGYDILMYKHEQSFITMHKALEKAVKEYVVRDVIIINTLHEMILYPYKDIVGDGLASKIVEPIQKEIQIQKDIANLYKDE